MPEVITAVHDDDLDAVLQALGLLNKFRAGLLTCAFCKDTITHDNLYSIFPDGGTVKLSCAKPNCVLGLVKKQEGKSYG